MRLGVHGRSQAEANDVQVGVGCELDVRPSVTRGGEVAGQNEGVFDERFEAKAAEVLESGVKLELLGRALSLDRDFAEVGGRAGVAHAAGGDAGGADHSRQVAKQR